MPLYGIAAMIALSISIATLGVYSQYLTYQSTASSLIGSYTAVSRMESFSIATSNYYSSSSINATGTFYNDSYFGEIDGFNLEELNYSVIIYSKNTEPKYYLIANK
jgi:hypothetical protein